MPLWFYWVGLIIAFGALGVFMSLSPHTESMLIVIVVVAYFCGGKRLVKRIIARIPSGPPRPTLDRAVLRQLGSSLEDLEDFYRTGNDPILLHSTTISRADLKAEIAFRACGVYSPVKQNNIDVTPSSVLCTALVTRAALQIKPLPGV